MSKKRKYSKRIKNKNSPKRKNHNNKSKKIKKSTKKKKAGFAGSDTALDMGELLIMIGAAGLALMNHLFTSIKWLTTKVFNYCMGIINDMKIRCISNNYDEVTEIIAREMDESSPEGKQLIRNEIIKYQREHINTEMLIYQKVSIYLKSSLSTLDKSSKKDILLKKFMENEKNKELLGKIYENSDENRNDYDKHINNLIDANQGIDKKYLLALQWKYECKLLDKYSVDEYLSKLKSGWTPQNKDDEEYYDIFKRHLILGKMIKINKADIQNKLSTFDQKTLKESKKTVDSINSGKIRAGSKIKMNKKTEKNLIKAINKIISNNKKRKKTSKNKKKKRKKTVKKIKAGDGKKDENETPWKSLGIFTIFSGIYAWARSTQEHPDVEPSILDPAGHAIENIPGINDVVQWWEGDDYHEHSATGDLVWNLLWNPNFGMLTMIQKVIEAPFDFGNWIVNQFPNDPAYLYSIEGIAIAAGAALTVAGIKAIKKYRTKLISQSDDLMKKKKVLLRKREQILAQNSFSKNEELREINKFIEQIDDLEDEDKFVDKYKEYLTTSYLLKIKYAIKICEPNISKEILEIKSQNILKFLQNKYENMKEVHENYQKYVFKFRLKQ